MKADTLVSAKMARRSSVFRNTRSWLTQEELFSLSWRRFLAAILIGPIRDGFTVARIRQRPTVNTLGLAWDKATASLEESDSCPAPASPTTISAMARTPPTPAAEKRIREHYDEETPFVTITGRSSVRLRLATPPLVPGSEEPETLGSTEKLGWA
jgi:hypothetical protein